MLLVFSQRRSIPSVEIACYRHGFPPTWPAIDRASGTVDPRTRDAQAQANVLFEDFHERRPLSSSQNWFSSFSNCITRWGTEKKQCFGQAGDALRSILVLFAKKSIVARAQGVADSLGIRAPNEPDARHLSHIALPEKMANAVFSERVFPDVASALPFPFLLFFLEQSLPIAGEPTVCETETQTGDGAKPPETDYADDTDVEENPDFEQTAAVIADSNTKEDADY